MPMPEAAAPPPQRRSTRLRAKRPDLQPPAESNARFMSVPFVALQEHYSSILSCVLSSILCTQMGYAEIWIIDPLIIKSIFVLFGFTMGFRNVRANQRYFDALQQAAGLFAGFWGVYAPLPREIRDEFREELLEVMQHVAEYIHRVGESRDHTWCGILGVEPALERAHEGDFEGGNSFDFRGLDARCRMVSELTKIDRELQKRGDGSLQRNFALHQKQILQSYDYLLALALPSVTSRFRVFVHICLGFFTLFLPWGIMAKGVEFDFMGHWQIGPGVVLMFNTTAVIWVLFILNSILTQNEDPVSGDPDDVNLILLTNALLYEVQDHEQQRREAAAAQGSA